MKLIFGPEVDVNHIIRFSEKFLKFFFFCDVTKQKIDKNDPKTNSGLNKDSDPGKLFLR